MAEIYRINLNERSYPIYIGHSLINIGRYIKKHIPKAVRTFIITNTTVDCLYGHELYNILFNEGLNPAKGVIEDGEKYKSFEVAYSIYDLLIEHEMDRHSVIISLGGGVIGDLAGFIAATYFRGIPFVQIPTTLLSQVDSSIGGKSAINHSKGKNLIGTFIQPKFVLIDIKTLFTLPKEEFKSGMAEVIKHGMILDNDYFNWINTNLDSIQHLNTDSIIKLISWSCAIKGKVVIEDEKEENIRAILNFGHTIGHALEALTEYKYYRHGEAVSIGMVIESKLAYKMGMISINPVNRLVEILEKIGLPTSIPSAIDSNNLIKAIKRDKKKVHDKVKMILPSSIGEVNIIENWSEEYLLNSLK
ncbi:3-dehydroquinate synthase [Haloplasma contractile]|uniref:3-dehydroquinate synthase n=1 Tax=Haloplasma contractile SSD-17B TaxID=1033810 RepID=U2E935_9MOLU|nr:3-dehydroquinate synthase [Haloplasma contractile]ERJ11653.1 3-dehydroquinate synthase protein [Haloplasma contractile SSD-17B]